MKRQAVRVAAGCGWAQVAARPFAAAARARPRVVIVGAGWAGYRAAQDICKDTYDVHVISPRNHFLFTPLLPSTTVGTLEFRAIQEPVRTIPHVHYSQSVVHSVDFQKQSVTCGDLFKENFNFDMPYDLLILAPGSETNTLGVPGVLDNPNVFFLKQLRHSRAIRNQLIDCFERAASPAVLDQATRARLLTFVVVGGGPTNIEFASELHDFIKGDVSKWYPDLLPHVRIKVIEASGHILGSFNSSLVSYVESLFDKRHVDVLTSTTVKEVRDNVAALSDGSEIPFGLMVWSTGIKQVPLIEGLPADQVAKFKNGRIKVDPWLRVCRAAGGDGDACVPVGGGRVLALGDCAADCAKPLPALAQVASQQAQYVAKVLNAGGGLDALVTASPAAGTKMFKYGHLGSMANVGEWKGVYDSGALGVQGHGLTGFNAFLLWRAAYWTKQVSLRNKILIPMYWLKCMLFGRDICRF